MNKEIIEKFILDEIRMLRYKGEEVELTYGVIPQVDKSYLIVEDDRVILAQVLHTN